jgi:hypothetical protein
LLRARTKNSKTTGEHLFHYSTTIDFHKKKLLEIIYTLWKKNEVFFSDIQNHSSGNVETVPSFALAQGPK